MYKLNKNLKDYFIPSVLSTILPALIILSAYTLFLLVVKVGIYFGFQWASTTPSFWTLTVPVAFSGFAFLFISYLLGKKILKPTNADIEGVKQLFLKNANSLNLNILILFLYIVIYKLTIPPNMYISTYLSTYLLSTFFISFSYFSGPLIHARPHLIKIGIFYFYSVIILLSAYDFYISEGTNFSNIFTVVIFLIYLFVTLKSSGYIAVFLKIEKETILQKSILLSWLLFLLIAIEYIALNIGFDSAEQYLQITFTLFVPIIIGAILSSYTVIKNDKTPQKPYAPSTLDRNPLNQKIHLNKPKDLLIFFGDMLMDLIICFTILFIHTPVTLIDKKLRPLLRL